MLENSVRVTANLFNGHTSSQLSLCYLLINMKESSLPQSLSVKRLREKTLANIMQSGLTDPRCFDHLGITQGVTMTFTCSYRYNIHRCHCVGMPFNS